LIIQAATGLFYRQGIEATPIQAIINNVGIAKGTFYHHFASKEDLLTAVLGSLTERVLAEIDPILTDATTDGRTKLIYLFQKSSTIKMADFRQTLVLLQQMVHGSDPGFQKAMEAAAMEKVVPLFERVLRLGEQDGSLDAPWPEQTARMLVNMFMGFQHQIAVLTLEAAAGSDEALQKIMSIYAASQCAIERLLGQSLGALPLFNAQEFMQKIQEVRHDPGI
jgi:AcrR family transcriptional regulator